jgi:hypothetical protein
VIKELSIRVIQNSFHLVFMLGAEVFVRSLQI